MRGMKPEKRILINRFRKSMATYDDNAVVQRDMAGELVELIATATGICKFSRIMELGCGTGFLTRWLIERFKPRELVLNDLVPDCQRTAQELALRHRQLKIRFIPGDMESIALPRACDLIASNAAFQWADEPDALMDRMAAALKPCGVTAIASFGPSNLKEVARLTGLTLKYWSLDEFRRRLTPHFAVLDASETKRTLHFKTAQDVIQHLRRTGANAIDSKPWSRGRLTRFAADYERAFGSGGEVPLTYHALYAVARKQPRKGSAA